MPVRASNRGSRASPLSTTTRTPSTVSDVSAMSVDSTTRRRPGADGASAEILLGDAQRTGERKHVDIVGDHLAELRFGPPDLADPRQEHEHVANLFLQRPHDGRHHRRFDPVLARSSRSAAPASRRWSGRHPVHVDVEHAALALDHRRAEEAGQALDVGCRRHRQQAEIGTDRRGDIEREGEAEIGREIALVDLVEDHETDARQLGVVLQASREHTFGEHFDAGVGTDVALVARVW